MESTQPCISQEKADDYAREAFSFEDGSTDWRSIRLTMLRDAEEVRRLREQRTVARRAFRELHAAHDRLVHQPPKKRDLKMFFAGIVTTALVVAVLVSWLALAYGVLR